MLLGRAAIYFDEVARRGGLRRAAEMLHIAPSAIDRQIIQLEEDLGTKLFERTSTGMRMTAAGELLVDGVRRWRRDLERIRSEVDNLVGLRRGHVSIGLVEGATDIVASAIACFQEKYPAIQYSMEVMGSQSVIDRVMSHDTDVGVTFNPPDERALRVEKTMFHRLGIILRPDHPLASVTEVSLAQCAEFPLIVPDETISIRKVVDEAWARSIGGVLRPVAEVSSIGLIKSLAARGVGLGLLTVINALKEIEAGELTFIPLSDERIDLFGLSVISASGRALPLPASLMIQMLARELDHWDYTSPTGHPFFLQVESDPPSGRQSSLP
ncbi:LysR family transcriptional regulator [Novosphingobium indicum]|uniref:LysR family transcriptional regulator n=1 Tax=Novosphingobium indicum TaxID=462949 RepID=A0ABQ2JW65_9SPHN|nr:LysR family transcriptional regulator [Novosphingobium indicum]GGN59256.1 LysR family transcriptional regulator [Novosphingobium indicum]